MFLFGLFWDDKTLCAIESVGSCILGKGRLRFYIPMIPCTCAVHCTGSIFCKMYFLQEKGSAAISFQEYVSKGITHPVFYGDFFYKLRRIKGETNFISSGSNIVKRLRRRQYDPAIIGRTICLVLGPFTAFEEHYLKLDLYDKNNQQIN